MVDHKHYVPVLRGKAGEYRSLQKLDVTVKARLTPILEPPPVPWDYQEETFAKTIEAHLGPVGQHIEESWGGDRVLFVDLRLLPEDQRMSDGSHPLSAVLSEGRRRKLKMIPVTGHRRDSDYQAAVKAGLVTDRRGVCVRLESEDFEEVEAALRSQLEWLDVSAEQVDLVIDLGWISPDQGGTHSVALLSILNALPNSTAWRTLTVVATGFPQNLSGIPGDSIERIERAEWTLWKRLRERRNRIPRLPTFGDYGIQHPEITEVDPRIMKMSANLRYTTDDAWLILKGRDVKDRGFEQFNALCAALVQRPEYRGPQFSWGDAYVARCANDTDGPGNATTWRQVGTTHHLTFVTQQIASLPGL